MRAKPHVDAIEVETVAALREQPSHFTVGQLGEADGALDPLLEVRRPVNGDGQRPKHGGFKATTRDREGAEVGGGEVKARPRAGAEGGAQAPLGV